MIIKPTHKAFISDYAQVVVPLFWPTIPSGLAISSIVIPDGLSLSAHKKAAQIILCTARLAGIASGLAMISLALYGADKALLHSNWYYHKKRCLELYAIMLKRKLTSGA